jgi:hypothetical protein
MLAQQRFFTQQRPTVACRSSRVQPRIVASARGLAPLVRATKAIAAGSARNGGPQDPKTLWDWRLCCGMPARHLASACRRRHALLPPLARPVRSCS